MRRRVLPVVVCVAVFYGVFVSVRVEQHSVLWFVHLGKEFVTASHESTVITPKLGWQSEVGYDGQYYFFLAADPRKARFYMPDRAGIIYSRVFYPAVSRAAAGGSVRAIPYAMLTINLLAVVAGTFAVGLWLRRRGHSPWPAALYGLYPGLVFTVFRDLTEPLAFALVALAVLVFDSQSRRRLVAAAGLFALAALTRETTLPFALAAAATLAVADRGGSASWRSWRPWRRALPFAVGAFVPLLLWRLIAGAYTHEPTQETGSGIGWLFPFHGLAVWWPFDDQHWLIFLTVLLPALAVAAGAALLLRQRCSPILAGLLVLNVLAYVVFLPWSVDVDYAAAARASIGVVLAAIYCLPAWREARTPRVALGSVAFVWSLAWYLLAAALLGVAGIRLITT